MQSTDWIQKYKTCLYGKSTIDIPLDLASLISRFWDLSMYLACSSTLNLKHKTRISLCASYSSIYFFKKPLTTNTTSMKWNKKKNALNCFSLGHFILQLLFVLSLHPSDFLFSTTEVGLFVLHSLFIQFSFSIMLVKK